MGDEAEASLLPGFRFDPTDEDLVHHYLKRKVCGKPIRFDAISEVDLYKSAPWDLPGQSRLKSKDPEGYFFCALDKKYSSGSKANRATEKGYWQITDKDRSVRRNDRTIGMKKTLVFHTGRAPSGERTNWLMHEYRLVDEQLEQKGVSLDAYVLCRIFRKSGSGPKNGEHYGAPFNEQECDENVFVPLSEVPNDTYYDVDGGFLEQNDLEQNIEMSPPLENLRVPSGSSSFGNAHNRVEGFVEHDQKFSPERDDYLPDEYFIELNDLVNPVVADEPHEEMAYLDAFHNQPIANDEAFLEIDDLSIPFREEDPPELDTVDEGTYFDAIDDNLENVELHSSEISGTEDSILAPSASKQEVKEEPEHVLLESPQPVNADGGDGSSSSKRKSESTKLAEEDRDNTLAKRVNRMLESISAAPAFAAEFPIKDATLGQNSNAQSSGSIHFTTQMIRIRSVTVNGGMNNSALHKTGDVDYLLPYGMTRNNVTASEYLIGNSVGVGLKPMAKAGPVMLRSGLYLVFIWVLILSVSFTVGYHIYIR